MKVYEKVEVLRSKQPSSHSDLHFSTDTEIKDLLSAETDPKIVAELKRIVKSSEDRNWKIARIQEFRKFVYVVAKLLK